MRKIKVGDVLLVISNEILLEKGSFYIAHDVVDTEEEQMVSVESGTSAEFEGWYASRFEIVNNITELEMELAKK